MTEADAGLPETQEQALSLSKERLERIAPKPTQKAASAPTEPPAQAQAADDEGKATQGDEPSPEPKKAEYSFVANPVLRAALEANPLPDEAVESLKGWMADYTQKSQKAARVDEYEKKARAFDDLVEIPGAQEALAGLLARQGKPEAPEVEDVPDLSSMDSKDIIAFFDKRIEAKAQALAERMVAERVEKPVARVQGVLSTVKAMYGEWKDKVTEATYRSAWDEARADYGDDAFTPENAKILFTPYLKAAAARQELEAIKGAKAKSAEVAKRATSPAGSATAAPRPSQAPIAPGDKAAIRARTLAMLEEQNGWTASDLDAAART